MIKKYIIKKLIKWLDLENIKRDIERNYREFKAFRKISHEDMGIVQNQIHNINQLCSIGVDVSVRDNRNWAVICIEGKPNFVKFVDLSRSDIMEVQRFLKQFEGSNRIVDAPYTMDLIYFNDKLWSK